jgi:hypothetical protein
MCASYSYLIKILPIKILISLFEMHPVSEDKKASLGQAEKDRRNESHAS